MTQCAHIVTKVDTQSGIYLLSNTLSYKQKTPNLSSR